MQQAERANEPQIEKRGLAAGSFFVEDGDALDFTSESQDGNFAGVEDADETGERGKIELRRGGGLNGEILAEKGGVELFPFRVRQFRLRAGGREILIFRRQLFQQRGEVAAMAKI